MTYITIQVPLEDRLAVFKGIPEHGPDLLNI